MLKDASQTTQLGKHTHRHTHSKREHHLPNSAIAITPRHSSFTPEILWTLIFIILYLFIYALLHCQINPVTLSYCVHSPPHTTLISTAQIRELVLARHNTATYRKYSVQQSVIGQYVKVLQTNLYLSARIRIAYKYLADFQAA